MERRVFSEDSGTSTVDDRRSRIKSAGRQVSRISDTDDVEGVMYCNDCLKRSILPLATENRKPYSTVQMPSVKVVPASTLEFKSRTA